MVLPSILDDVHDIHWFNDRENLHKTHGFPIKLKLGSAFFFPTDFGSDVILQVQKIPRIAVTELELVAATAASSASAHPQPVRLKVEM